mgnify:FL=1
MGLSRVVFSSNSDHWATPTAVYDALDAEFEFTFDPCPLNSAEDGLKVDWRGRAYCNPPYSKIPQFIKKGLYHLAHGNASLLVYLLPARTDTGWFHDYCLKAAEIRFLRGRLKFGNAQFNAPFPSMVVVFREWTMPVVPLDAA